MSVQSSFELLINALKEFETVSEEYISEGKKCSHLAEELDIARETQCATQIAEAREALSKHLDLLDTLRKKRHELLDVQKDIEQQLLDKIDSKDDDNNQSKPVDP
jgi:hypothetical protein